jgi:hypothetical protein
MTRDALFDLLARLRRASVGGLRAPHKPLLLLWLFGRFAVGGSTAAAYTEAEEPVSALISDFGPPVAKASAGRHRAAMPFVHLEREIWDLRDSSGAEIGPDAPERGSWLASRGAVGRLRPEVERLIADPGTLAAAARLLLDLHFTPGLAAMICDSVGLDLAVLELAASPAFRAARRGVRRSGFAEDVLRAYAYQCAIVPPAHPGVEPVCGTQRRRPGGRPARGPGIARTQARAPRRGSGPHQVASPAGVQGNRRASGIDTPRVHHPRQMVATDRGGRHRTAADRGNSGHPDTATAPARSPIPGSSTSHDGR